MGMEDRYKDALRDLDLMGQEVDRLKNNIQLSWSNVLPKKDGWYWIKDSGGASVVQVVAGWVHSVLSMEPVRLKDYEDPEIEWYGPIKPPMN